MTAIRFFPSGMAGGERLTSAILGVRLGKSARFVCDGMLRVKRAKAGKAQLIGMEGANQRVLISGIKKASK